MGASIKIINAEYGVASCPKEDIPLYILKYCKAENVTYFLFTSERLACIK